MTSFLSYVLLASALISCVYGVDYEYSNKDEWNTLFENFCGGDRQSPINIDRTATSFDFKKFFQPFQFMNYGTAPESQKTVNNFHTLSITSDFLDTPTITGGGLPGTYEAVGLHFHWGGVNTQGSEHTIDTIRYPLEAHIVHKLRGVPIETAIEVGHGLAVLGIFFEVSTNDNPALQPILDTIDTVKSSNTAEGNVVSPLSYASILPNDLRRYYRYDGSLTTPVCNEAVVWTVFKQPVHVSEAQLTKLREMLDVNGDPLVDNYRNPQALNGRTVYRSWL